MSSPGFFSSKKFKEFADKGFADFLTVGEACAVLGLKSKTLLRRCALDETYLAPQLRAEPTGNQTLGSLFGLSRKAVEAELAMFGKGHLRDAHWKRREEGRLD